MHQSKKTLSFLSLVAMTLVSVDSIRNLPALAIFGQDLPAMYLMAALFISIGLDRLILSAHFKDKPGIFHWVSSTRIHGRFLCSLVQWVNNLVWYPVILPFIVSTGLYVIDPALATQGHLIAWSTIAVFWGLTF